jgi:transcriptional antiterminator NusG
MHRDYWHVSHVMANHEKRVAQHLAVRSIEHFLPLYTERSRWTDRTVQIERPLFVGYVFVRFSTRARLSVLSTPGVIRLLGEHNSQKVSPVELARIRESLAGGQLLRPHPCVSIGTEVRIRTGIFEGVTGVVTEFRKQCNVIISLAALQQCFSLELGIDDLEVVKETVSQPLYASARC